MLMTVVVFTQFLDVLIVNALNYDPNVLIDDGSCIYPILGCTDSTIILILMMVVVIIFMDVDDGSCIYYVLGCTDTDTSSCNYNPNNY